MTAVYSGGLVYEYSQEASNYGLVEITGSGVNELADFTALMAAFKKTANPSGDGGYNSTGGASGCPAQSANWNVTSDALPAIPDGAKKFMTQGAGAGVGLTGAGSQNAGGASTATASAGSGSVTAVATGASSTATKSKSAASSLRQGPMDTTPIFLTAMIIGFTGLGAFLL